MELEMIRSVRTYQEGPPRAMTTVGKTAKRCGTSTKWWYRRIDDRTCPVTVYRIGKHVRFDDDEVSLWIEACADPDFVKGYEQGRKAFLREARDGRPDVRFGTIANLVQQVAGND